MKKNNFLLIEQDPDGRTNIVKQTPIAIYRGEANEEAVKNIIRITAKYLADGDFSRIAEKEAIVAEEADAIRDIIINKNGNAFFADNCFIAVQPIAIREDYLYYHTSPMCYVALDYESQNFINVSGPESGIHPEDLFDVAVLETNAYNSPFMFASPFIIKGKELYAVDTQTGVESGPYNKAVWEGSFYLVNASGKAGVVSMRGRLIADCDYDSAYCLNGYAVLVKDGKQGFYSPMADVLVPCVYDDVEIPEDPDSPFIAIKDGVRGFTATDGTFHPLTNDEDLDLSLTYL